MRVLRTPADRFAALPDFAYQLRCVDVGGLQIGYVEAGRSDCEAVLHLHGEPSWSFLSRRVMAVLAGAEPLDGGRVTRTRDLRIGILTQHDDLTGPVGKLVLGDLPDRKSVV